ncbi:MAG: hypothetical protein K1X79_04570 [Oligoflexia bacterium]|nr:hypothetical protein [Oligoflexia bacterium]
MTSPSPAAAPNLENLFQRATTLVNTHGVASPANRAEGVERSLVAHTEAYGEVAMLLDSDGVLSIISDPSGSGNGAAYAIFGGDGSCDIGSPREQKLLGQVIASVEQFVGELAAAGAKIELALGIDGQTGISRRFADVSVNVAVALMSAVVVDGQSEFARVAPMKAAVAAFPTYRRFIAEELARELGSDSERRAMPSLLSRLVDRCPRAVELDATLDALKSEVATSSAVFSFKVRTLISDITGLISGQHDADISRRLLKI